MKSHKPLIHYTLLFLAGILMFFLLKETPTDRDKLPKEFEPDSMLSDQISMPAKPNEEIKELRERRQQLLERMKIIQDLQGNRPIIGRVFDQLVRTLPEGVYFTSLKMAGKNIAIVGAAESNNRVSNLMRNLDGSDWLEAPNLNEVKAVTAGAVDQENVFQLTVQQTQPGASTEGAKP